MCVEGGTVVALRRQNFEADCFASFSGVVACKMPECCSDVSLDKYHPLHCECVVTNPWALALDLSWMKTVYARKSSRMLFTN